MWSHRLPRVRGRTIGTVGTIFGPMSEGRRNAPMGIGHATRVDKSTPKAPGSALQGSGTRVPTMAE